MTPTQILTIVDLQADEITDDDWASPDGQGPDFSIGFRNSNPCIIQVANDGPLAAVCRVTILAVRPCSQGELHNYVKDIPGGGGWKKGPFDILHYSDVDGYVQVRVESPGAPAFALADIGLVVYRTA